MFGYDKIPCTLEWALHDSPVGVLGPCFRAAINPILLKLLLVLTLREMVTMFVPLQDIESQKEGIPKSMFF